MRTREMVDELVRYMRATALVALSLHTQKSRAAIRQEQLSCRAVQGRPSIARTKTTPAHNTGDTTSGELAMQAR